ncbi:MULTISPECIES: DUF2934 domain-containing protein [unclassified Mesorhizobium]|uniref:DUF2934 domain-containing protein n=1 Tax=unclassified Mesorhizobium TaxID=325217 RepID=UPI001FEDB6C5|nr:MULTISPECIES: DUF2934 domain-containing protein [unclassified Mesorhizobium]
METMTMTDDRQERIRSRAHHIWQEEGQPAGQHERHWQQATADIDQEDAGSSAVKKPARKAAVAGKAKTAPKEAKTAAKPRKPKKAAK